MLKNVAVCFIMVIVASLCFAVPVSAEPNMQEGQWDISGEMKLEGMSFPMPAMPIKYSQCLTKKDLVPQQREKNKDCKLISTKTEGDAVSWVMQCKDKSGTTDSTGTITYKGAVFDGTIQTVTTDAKGDKTTANLKMAGKRAGDCK